MLVKELLFEGKRILTLNGNVSPALDAALLLSEISALSREELITHNDHELDIEQCRCFFEFIERRCKGESIAYILGRKEFRGLEFSVTPDVLVPRPETEILVDIACAIICSISSGNSFPYLSVLDLCTGSGAVAIALKHEHPFLDVFASDISEKALDVARKNAETLGAKITFFEGDLFDAINKHGNVKEESRFFLITANAPYIPSKEIPFLSAEVRLEPRRALDGGTDGLEIIRRIISGSPRYLKPGGYLALEADPSQMDTIVMLLKDSGFSEPALYKDLAGNNRVISAVIDKV